MQDCGSRPEWRLAFIARVVRLLQAGTPTAAPEPRGRIGRRAATPSNRNHPLRSARGC